MHEVNTEVQNEPVSPSQTRPKSIFRYKTDRTLENEGVWIRLADGEEFRIRSTESERVRDLDTRWTKKHRQQIMAAQGILSPALQDEKEIHLLVEGIVIEWRKVYGENGVEIRYSKQTCRELLSDPEMRELRSELMYLARQSETFRKEETEEATKN